MSGWPGADAVFGLLIAAWLLWGAWSSSSEALEPADGPRMARGERAPTSSPRRANIPSLRACTICAPAAAAPTASSSSTSGCRATGRCAQAHDRLDPVEEALQAALSRHRNPDPRRSRRPDRPRDPAAGTITERPRLGRDAASAATVSAMTPPPSTPLAVVADRRLARRDAIFGRGRSAASRRRAPPAPAAPASAP